jgi:hypothetical protein
MLGIYHDSESRHAKLSWFSQQAQTVLFHWLFIKLCYFTNLKNPSEQPTKYPIF